MELSKARPYLLAILPIVIFLIGWEIFSSTGIIDQALFSKPSIVLGEIAEDYQLFLENLSATLLRTALAFVAALSISVIIGVMMGYSRPIYRFLDPLITTLMPIPGIAMAPLFIVWFGFGNLPIILIGTIVAFFPIVYNVSMGVRSIDRQLVRAARIMGAGRREMFVKVYLPNSLSHLVIGIKLGLARCWRTVIAVEFIAATSYGLGYLIWDAYEYLNVSVVYAGIIIIAVTFFVLERTLIRQLERRTVERWGVIDNE
jgi:ABC-type nitrate/sulfonate/bicarbonate transport system permease component